MCPTICDLCGLFYSKLLLHVIIDFFGLTNIVVSIMQHGCSSYSGSAETKYEYYRSSRNWEAAVGWERRLGL